MSRHSKTPSSFNSGNSVKLWNKHPHKEAGMFAQSMADMNDVKADLQHLMDDFKNGKLKDIGAESTRKQMDNIQVMQNKLADLHFKLDAEINYSILDKTVNVATDQITEKQDENMITLMTDLEGLGNAIKSLDSLSKT